jgi:cobalt-zinc-cadmium efflux system outer membrane protein
MRPIAVILLLSWSLSTAIGQGEPLHAPRSEPAVWSFDKLLALMHDHHPDLAIAHARVEAARGKLIQAGLYPNPTFMYMGEDMGSPHGSAGNQGPVLGQQFLTAGKRRLAMAAGEAGVSQADWQAITVWYDTLTRLRIAYYELAIAEREIATQQTGVQLAEAGLKTAEILYKTEGTQVDVLRAQVELQENRTRLAVARQRRDAAWRLLAAAAGVPRLEPGSITEDLETPAPAYEYQAVLHSVLTGSATVQAAQAGVLQAEWLVQKAQADRYPDVEVRVRPFYSFPDQNTQATVEIGGALPIFNRNQGNIRTAQAELALMQAEARKVEILLGERLAMAFEQFQSARQQVESYRQDILPAARKSLDLVRLAYSKGQAKTDYTSVLQAQRTLIEAELGYVRAVGQLWKAVAEIRGLLQEE